MAGLTIGTDKQNARLGFVAILLFLCQLPNLIPISFGIFGSIWPIAVIWAIGAWSDGVANSKYGAILFIAGLIMDVLSATNLGTFAAVYVITYIAVLVHIRYFGALRIFGYISPIIISFYLLLACLVVGAVAKQWPNFLALVLPLVTTILLYPFMSKLFATHEPTS